MLNVVNIGAALALFALADPGAQQVYGLAAAFVLSYWVILLVAWPLLSRRMGGLQTRATLVSAGKVFLASAVAVGVLVLLPVQPYQPGDPKLEALWYCVVVSVVVLVVYAAAVMVLRVPEARDLMMLVRSRLGRGGERSEGP